MLRITFTMCVLVLLLQAAIGQLAKNREQKTSTNEGVPAKDRDINLGRASGSLGQIRTPLPPPSNGWTVIMQRFDLSLNFNRNWTEYKNGFGELGLQKEFWLGNEAMHLLTSGVPHKLRVELVTNDTLFYADYDSFSVDSEDKNYTIHVSGYSGNAGDSLTGRAKGARYDGHHDGAGFSTPDVENDRHPEGNCGVGFGTGWWFDKCYDACLTCHKDAFIWYSLRLLEPKLSTDYFVIGARMRVIQK